MVNSGRISRFQRRGIAIILLGTLLSPLSGIATPFAAPEHASQPINQRDKSDVIVCDLGAGLVFLTALVTDANGSVVTNLTRHNFIVTDRKRVQNIEAFMVDDEPLNVSIVVPSSEHRNSSYSQTVYEAIRAFRDIGNQKNRYSIITDGVNSTFFGGLISHDDAVMDGVSVEWRERLSLPGSQQAKAVFDLCAIAHTQLNPGDGEPILLLFDPGDATKSQLTYSDLREQIRHLNVPVYSFSFKDGQTNDTKALKHLSSVTGGASFEIGSPTELTNVVARVASELRHRYAIAYYPTAFKKDGTWHRVRVKAFDDQGEPKPLNVRTFTGYIAPYADETPRSN